MQEGNRITTDVRELVAMRAGEQITHPSDEHHIAQEKNNLSILNYWGMHPVARVPIKYILYYKSPEDGH
jgi:hypothetical protein